MLYNALTVKLNQSPGQFSNHLTKHFNPLARQLFILGKIEIFYDREKKTYNYHRFYYIFIFDKRTWDSLLRGRTRDKKGRLSKVVPAELLLKLLPLDNLAKLESETGAVFLEEALLVEARQHEEDQEEEVDEEEAAEHPPQPGEG